MNKYLRISIAIFAAASTRGISSPSALFDLPGPGYSQQIERAFLAAIRQPPIIRVRKPNGEIILLPYRERPRTQDYPPSTISSPPPIFDPPGPGYRQQIERALPAATKELPPPALPFRKSSGDIMLMPVPSGGLEINLPSGNVSSFRRSRTIAFVLPPGVVWACSPFARQAISNTGPQLEVRDQKLR